MNNSKHSGAKRIVICPVNVTSVHRQLKIKGDNKGHCTNDFIVTMLFKLRIENLKNHTNSAILLFLGVTNG